MRKERRGPFLLEESQPLARMRTSKMSELQISHKSQKSLDILFLFWYSGVDFIEDWGLWLLSERSCQESW